MENFMVDKFTVEKYGAEEFRVEKSRVNPTGLSQRQSSFLKKKKIPSKSPDPVRVKDSGVEISCNLHKPGRKRSKIDLCPRFF